MARIGRRVSAADGTAGDAFGARARAHGGGFHPRKPASNSKVGTATTAEANKVCAVRVMGHRHAISRLPSNLPLLTPSRF